MIPATSTIVPTYDYTHGRDLQLYETNIFCSRCKTILRKSLEKSQDIGISHHHTTFADLLAAVDEGCYICNIFFERFIELGRLGKVIPDSAPRDEQTVFTKVFVTYSKSSSPLAKFYLANDFSVERIFSICECSDFTSPALSTSTSSSHTRSQIASWLGNCRANHSCSSHTASRWMPSRIIDVGERTDSSWKLCISAEAQVKLPEYVTMSYRWGNDGSGLKLTRQTIDKFCLGMQNSTLPQVFQDAIAITKDLGIRYLWIDALCILQDGSREFHQECAEMSDIYAGSVCNIVASFGRGPCTSLFTIRDQKAIQIGRLGPTKGCNKFEAKDDHCFDLDTVAPVFYTAELDSCEVASRGWILQERLLAPRMIVFGENQVYWKCDDLQACEVFPRGMPSFVESKFLGSGFTNILLTCPKALLRQWSDMVGIYTTLHLTNIEDRLVGISGLARRIQQRTQDHYLAGLWRSNLLFELFWSVWLAPVTHSIAHGVSAADSRYPRRLAAYIAPTWSWASIEGPIFWPLVRHHMTERLPVQTIASVESVSVNPWKGDSGNAFEKLSASQITLRSPLIVRREVLQAVFKHAANPDEKLPDHTDQATAMSAVASDCEVFCWDTPPPSNDLDVLLAPIHTRTLSIGSAAWRFEIFALVLCPSKDGQGRYTREGLYWCHFWARPDHSSNPSTYHDVLDAFGLTFAEEGSGIFVVKESSMCVYTII